MRGIGLVVHHGRSAAVAAAADVRTWAESRDVAVTELDVGTGHPDGVDRLHAAEEAARAGHPDLIVTLGGDGTFLRGVRIAAAADAAVLGANVGRVGFLTEVTTDELVEALDAVQDGTALTEERMTLALRASRPLTLPEGVPGLLKYGRGPALPPPLPHPGRPGDDGWGVGLDVIAVNDVVFEKLARDRQAGLALYFRGRLFASYSADALIVASSTGSTAYSFAAGGPILSPRLDAMVVTPVAPHMVFDRSIVVAGDEPVAVRVLDHSGQVAVSVDGQLRGLLDPGNWIAVYSSPWRARLVRLRPVDFYGRVRQRFSLSDAPAAAADGSAPPEYRPDTPVPEELTQLKFTD
ncbi:MAG: NAD(+) kinase [Pseudonocardiales bacterium]|nr:MAG: NAD(+) kinase [Pseudonocardiales bacterium]